MTAEFHSSHASHELYLLIVIHVLAPPSIIPKIFSAMLGNEAYNFMFTIKMRNSWAAGDN